MASGDARRMKAAKNQSLFRTVNETLERLNEDFKPLLAHGEFICECANLQCVESLEMSVGEYEEVRRVPTHFAIKPGHELPEVERVVASNDRFVVVEKLGAFGAAARENDPRRSD